MAIRQATGWREKATVTSLAQFSLNCSRTQLAIRCSSGEGRTDGDADIVGFLFQVGELSGV